MRADLTRNPPHRADGFEVGLVAVAMIFVAASEWLVGRSQPGGELHVGPGDSCTTIRAGPFGAFPPVLSGIDRSCAEIVDSDSLVEEVVEVNIHLSGRSLESDVYRFIFNHVFSNDGSPHRRNAVQVDSGCAGRCCISTIRRITRDLIADDG